MTYFHQTKDAALEAAQVYESHWHTRASFVPNNGWVIVLTPRTAEVFQWPLAPMLDLVEIDLTSWARLHRKPEGYKRMAPVMDRAAVESKREPGAGPSPAGATGKVWAIADEMHKAGALTRADRSRVIAACQQAGINESTAATQWAKWAKARGI